MSRVYLNIFEHDFTSISKGGIPARQELQTLCHGKVANIIGHLSLLWFEERRPLGNYCRVSLAVYCDVCRVGSARHQLMHDGLLHVQSILRLIEDDALRTVTDLG